MLLRLGVLMLLAVAAVWAGPLPAGMMYDCGTYDCSAYAGHTGSTVGNTLPAGGNPTLDFFWMYNTTLGGNAAGQAIGCGFYTTGCAVVYDNGSGPVLLSPGPDLSLTGDINESGLWYIAAGQQFPYILSGVGGTIGQYSNEVITGNGIDVTVLFVEAVGEQGEVLFSGLASGGKYGDMQYVRGLLVDTPVPEPATFALLGAGLVGLAWKRRRA